MSTILIAGCGYVGNALASRLVQNGHQVFGMRRNPSALADGVQPLTANLFEPQSLQNIPPELDAVVYAASADGGETDAYRAAYVTGLRNMIEAAQSRCPSLARFIFTSSTGVYGQDQGEWVDENTPPCPSRETGEILLEGEQLLLQSGLPASVVRFSGIYGPGRDRFIRMARSPEARIRPADQAFTNRIHRDDCAAVLEHLLFRDNSPELVVGTDHDPATRAEILRWLAGKLDIPIPEEEGPLPASLNKRIRNQRLLETGYDFIYPTFREGFDMMLSS